MNDRIIAGSLAGIIATIIIMLINAILYLLKIDKYLLAHFNSILMLPPGSNFSILNLIIGYIAGLIAGMFFGAVLAILLTSETRKYIYLKGMGYGGILWIIHNSFFPNLITERLFKVLEPKGILMALFFEILWGTITTWLFSKFYRIKSA